MIVEILKVLGTVLVAVITTFGGGYFIMKKFYIEREDAKDKELLQKQIDDSIDKAMEGFIKKCGTIGDEAIEKAKREMHEELEEGLIARGEEGKRRFTINSEQIQKNTEQIAELTSLVKDQVVKLNNLTDAMTSANKVLVASAESQKSFNYDRLLFIANKVLKSGKMTISEKTNIKQLYNSWKDLNGNDPKIETLFEECMKITPIPDEA